jgi:ArsR family transcriptional regulator, arsenate/arsenite/antimonite-responsive transcriptional repressor
MHLTDIYQALSDPTRLRILHLLGRSPLCVQHLQAAMEAPQVMISKHLMLLKACGLVESQKLRNWRLYQLPPKPPAAIRNNLDCLLACIEVEQLFQEDLQRLATLAPDIGQLLPKTPKPIRKGSPRMVKVRATTPAPAPETSSPSVFENHLL